MKYLKSFLRWMGDHCERSFCEHNPCQSGGSCVIHPGSGFLCLCPYGKHGIFCEYSKMSFNTSNSEKLHKLCTHSCFRCRNNETFHSTFSCWSQLLLDVPIITNGPQLRAFRRKTSFPNRRHGSNCVTCVRGSKRSPRCKKSASGYHVRERIHHAYLEFGEW